MSAEPCPTCGCIKENQRNPRGVAVAMLRMISDFPRTTADMVEAFKISPSIASAHLSSLRKQGKIESRVIQRCTRGKTVRQEWRLPTTGALRGPASNRVVKTGSNPARSTELPGDEEDHERRAQQECQNRDAQDATSKGGSKTC